MDNLEQDPFELKPSRYVVGIDLGTTNCAVSFVDTANEHPKIQVLKVQQWVDFGTLEKRELLPSFFYQPIESELATLRDKTGRLRETIDIGSEKKDRPVGVVGILARDRGLHLPGHQVASAKSWLCHGGVDRTAPILPWQCDDGVQRMSPVEASAAYLQQIRQTWDASFPNEPLSNQDIVLTLPASFDQVARQLTIQAARLAGLPRVLPIEEPQAAFYAWLAKHSTNWEKLVRAGQTILVCDIGGGTTDFTLIRVRQRVPSEAGDDAVALNESVRSTLSLHRVAVGQHLILGGDNIDLALAKFAEQKLLPGKQLPPRTWDALRLACRAAKEELLSDRAKASTTIHLAGGGSRLIGSGQTFHLTKLEVERVVLEGFLPNCVLHDRPDHTDSGFQEYGLPFARDAAITKHLAAFLWDHRQAGRTENERQSLSDLDQACPDWILFNGGVMESTLLRQRIVDISGQWFAGTGNRDAQWRPGVLDAERLDLAVAMGAAYFGQVRRGEGVEIEAKLACSYYLQTGCLSGATESGAGEQAIGVCLIPGDASPGDRFDLSNLKLELQVGQPVQFPLVYSSTRLTDSVGSRVPIDDEHFARLPSIKTVLQLDGRKRQDAIQVQLIAELSQIGTLEMYCEAIDKQHRWKLEFDVRGSTETDAQSQALEANQEGIVSDETKLAARHVLERSFGASGELKPSKVMHELADGLQMSKGEWPPSLLRSIWQDLMDLRDGRRKSATHEARWINLLGYALRPGYGLAGDDWRVAETWRNVFGKLSFADPSSRSESLILWRRIAGGFTAGQQLTVYQQVAGPLRAILDPTKKSKGSVVGASNAGELAELLRLVGSLELLPVAEKRQLAEWLLELRGVKKWAACDDAMLWTIGRIAARVPIYGPLNGVMDSAIVSDWVGSLLMRPSNSSSYRLALMLACRRTNDRYRDVDAGTSLTVSKKLKQLSAPEHYIRLVDEGGALEGEETSEVFGDTLPLGLKLLHER